MTTAPTDPAALQDLRTKVHAARDIVDRIEGELGTLKATVNSMAIQNKSLAAAVKRMHHDHAGARQVVMVLLDELDRIAPAPPETR